MWEDEAQLAFAESSRQQAGIPFGLAVFMAMAA